MSTTPCSCGSLEPHVIARRQTFDSKRVEIWNDGQVTQVMGIFFPGKGMRSKLSSKAAAYVAANVCLYLAAELPELLKIAKAQ